MTLPCWSILYYVGRCLSLRRRASIPVSVRAPSRARPVLTFTFAWRLSQRLSRTKANLSLQLSLKLSLPFTHKPGKVSLLTSQSSEGHYSDFSLRPSYFPGLWPLGQPKFTACRPQSPPTATGMGAPPWPPSSAPPWAAT